MHTRGNMVVGRMDLRRLIDGRSTTMKLEARTAILIILGAAFVSFLLSVSLWFGVIGEPDRELGLFVGLWPIVLLLLSLILKQGV